MLEELVYSVISFWEAFLVLLLIKFSILFWYIKFVDVYLEIVSLYFFISSFTRSLHKEKDKETDILNIFSVASGHLYERFLR